jgi:NUC194 domain
MYAFLKKSVLDAASFSDTTTTYVELELDELNRHECMPSLIRLLQHMEQNKITPTVQEVGWKWIGGVMCVGRL